MRLEQTPDIGSCAYDSFHPSAAKKLFIKNHGASANANGISDRHGSFSKIEKDKAAQIKKDLPIKGPSNLRWRSDIRDSWERNKGKKASLEKDWNRIRQISALISEHLTARKSDSFLEKLQSCNDHLQSLAKVRLFDLSNLDLPSPSFQSSPLTAPKSTKGDPPMPDLPGSIQNVIKKLAWKYQAGEFLMRTLPELLVPNNFHASEFSKLRFKYVLEAVNFLSKNELVTWKAVESFFQRPEYSDTILKSIFAYHQDGIGIKKSIPATFEDMLKQWYGSSLETALKALEKKQQGALVYLNLKETLEIFLSSIDPHLQSWYGWALFSGRFYNHENFEPSKFLPHLEDDVKYLIEILKREDDPDHLIDSTEQSMVFYVVPLLDFFDKYISPGIIKRNSKSNKDFSIKTEIKYDFLKSFSRLQASSLRAKAYHAYFFSQDPSTDDDDESKESLYKYHVQSFFKSFDSFNQFLDSKKTDHEFMQWFTRKETIKMNVMNFETQYFFYKRLSQS